MGIDKDEPCFNQEEEWMHYWLQPIMDINGKVVLAYEFLCRWGEGKSWSERDSALMKALFESNQVPSERLHINLSPASILRLRPETYELAFKRFGEQLVLEWTEDPLSRTNAEVVANRLKYWRNKYGVQISIDDFGAGQDGLGRILLSDPDNVKIDGELFRAALKDRRYAAVLRKVCDWLNDTNTPIIVEYIEAPEELLFAKELGAGMGQGFIWNHRASKIHFPKNAEIAAFDTPKSESEPVAIDCFAWP